MPLPSWVPGDEVKPAPLPLLLVQSFVNTWESDSGTDLLGDPASAGRWLADAGLVNAGLVTDADGIDDADLSTAREVRESIRALLVHNGGGRLLARMSCGPGTTSGGRAASTSCSPRTARLTSSR